MKKMMFTALTLALMLGGCTKNDDDLRPECEKEGTGTISLRSYREDPYNVYLNNSYKGRISAYGTMYLEDIPKGTHTLKVEQHSGWGLWPTVFSDPVTISQCSTLNTGF